MYLSLSVNIHQSYRFKMKLDISNWNFCPVQTRKKIQLDISNWRMSKNPKIPVQIERRFGYFAFVILLGRSWNIFSNVMANVSQTFYSTSSLVLMSVSNRVKTTCRQNMFPVSKMSPQDPGRPNSSMTRFLSGSVPSMSLSSTSLLPCCWPWQNCTNWPERQTC